MQVLENTPQRLHVIFPDEIHNRRIQGILFLGLSLFFGYLILSDPIYKLTCQPQLDAPGVTCQATQSRLLRSPQLTLTAKDVQWAELGSRQHQLEGGRNVTVYTLRLMTRTGQFHTFAGETRSRAEQEQNVLAVNQYLASAPLKPLVIQIRQPWWSQFLLSVLVLAIAGLGLCFLIMPIAYACRLDRGSAQLLLREKRLQKTHRQIYQLSEIDQVKVDEHNYQNVTICLSVILLKSGKKISLMTHSACEDQHQVAKLINDFLQDSDLEASP